MLYTYLDSPVGRLFLAGTKQTLEVISFPGGSKARTPLPEWERDDAAFDAAKRQLLEYFDGARKRFDLPLVPHGTPFQRRVLDALLTIPYGETRSYRDVARVIGRPDAVRAVGAANGSNPLPIVIPCHRVIGADGSLTGFGGGLDRKRHLLELESRHSGLFG